jgi:hypothetical protein
MIDSMGTLDDAIDWDTFARGLALDFGQCAFDDAVRAQRVRVDAEGRITTTRLRMQEDELDVPSLKVSAG